MRFTKNYYFTYEKENKTITSKKYADIRDMTDCIKRLIKDNMLKEEEKQTLKFFGKWGELDEDMECIAKLKWHYLNPRNEKIKEAKKEIKEKEDLIYLYEEDIKKKEESINLCEDLIKGLQKQKGEINEELINLYEEDIKKKEELINLYEDLIKELKNQIYEIEEELYS